jgi:Ca-activated chloride channel family protein
VAARATGGRRATTREGAAMAALLSSSASLGLEHPQLLALLALAAIPLYLWRLARRNHATLAARLGGGSPPPPPPWPHILAVALLTVALASPTVTVYKRVELSVSSIDKAAKLPIALVVALDLSKSMSYREGPRTRLDMARDFITGMVTRIGNATIVLLGFSSTTEPLYSGPPAGVARVLHGLSAGGRYSAIGDAASTAAAYLRATRLPGAIVVVTDGGWNYGPDPVQVAKTLWESRIPTVFIIVGSDPRSYKLGERLREAGIPVYKLDSITYTALQSLVEEASRQVRLQALKAAGKTSVEVVAARETVSWIPALLAIAPLALILRQHAI